MNKIRNLQNGNLDLDVVIRGFIENLVNTKIDKTSDLAAEDTQNRKIVTIEEQLNNKLGLVKGITGRIPPLTRSLKLLYFDID